MMIFGTAGVPLSCKERDSEAGIRFAGSLGLGAFEFEFVHSARMGMEKAQECGKAAQEANIILSAHVPYFINLCSEEKEKVAASKVRILDTMRILHAAGGGRVVIHSGFFQKLEKKVAAEMVEAAYLDILETAKEEKITSAILAPETTGKPSAFGSLEELYGLSKDIGFGKLRPTIDFGHMHARTNGGIKSAKDYENIFDTVESFVGKEGLQKLHCHFTGIKFSEKGELKHLTIDSDSPRFDWLAQVLAERKCSGTIISESPNIEEDAIAMKGIYAKAIAMAPSK